MKKNILIVVLIAVIAGLTFTVVYQNKGEKKKEAKENTTVEKSEEKLDVNNQLVKNLYMLVENDNRCFNTYVKEEEFDLTADEISYDTKFQMAVAIMLESDKSYLSCDKYEPKKYIENALTNLSSLEGVSCQDNLYNSATNKFESSNQMATYTTLLKEDVIKSKMMQIFGKDYYQNKNGIDYGDILYSYIKEEQGYVIMKLPRGGTCNKHTNKLLSASLKDDEIKLSEEKTFEDNAKYLYTYTFKTTNNHDYYLTNINSKIGG